MSIYFCMLSYDFLHAKITVHLSICLSNCLINLILTTPQEVKLAWRSGCIMDCHATARGSIPGGNGVFTELHVLRKGQ